MLATAILTWLSTAAGLAVATLLLPGLRSSNLISLFAAAALLGIFNAFIRPLLWLMTAPLAVLTFGLFLLFINALLIQLAAALVPGYEVKGFGSALLAAIIMLLFNTALTAAIILATGDVSVEWQSHEFHGLPPR